jgi:ribonuclease HII
MGTAAQVAMTGLEWRENRRRRGVAYKDKEEWIAGPVPGSGIRRERAWWEQGAVVAGIDEVGRGAWAGSLTMAAVVLPSDRRMYKLRDSKLLDAPRREELAARLEGFALGIGIGEVTNEEIDQIGMSAAMRLAGARAVDALPDPPDVVLVDGNRNFLEGHGPEIELVVYGDASCASIAAASIVAKVTRDRQMTTFDPEHPRYGFASNKGYPSPEHKAALREHGPCGLHRHSWAPIAALLHPTLFDGVDPFDLPEDPEAAYDPESAGTHGGA